jgi:hypothetical protein
MFLGRAPETWTFTPPHIPMGATPTHNAPQWPPMTPNVGRDAHWYMDEAEHAEQ